MTTAPQYIDAVKWTSNEKEDFISGNVYDSMLIFSHTEVIWRVSRFPNELWNIVQLYSTNFAGMSPTIFGEGIEKLFSTNSWFYCLWP